MVGDTGLAGYVPMPGIPRNDLLNFISTGVCRVKDAARVAEVYGVAVKDVVAADLQSKA